MFSQTKHLIDHVQSAQEPATAHDCLISFLEAKLHPRPALRVSNLKMLAGDSRSQTYARMKPGTTAYDPTIPCPIYVGKSPRWWEHQVIAWLEAHAAATTR